MFQVTATYLTRHFILCGWTCAAIAGMHCPDLCVLADDQLDQQATRILQSKCGVCHGSDARKGELILTSIEGILAGGESGAIINWSDPQESELIDKIRTGQMPPEDSPQVSADELQVLSNWLVRWSRDRRESQPTITQHEVLPILLRRCTACHGRYVQEGGLDLRTVVNIFRGGKSGPAVVAGDVAGSLIIRRIRAQEMPPLDRLVDACVKPMEKAELETLAAWIAGGAVVSERSVDNEDSREESTVSVEDRAFWSFRSPTRPALPANISPAANNPIDAFVIARLAEGGLTLAPQADRWTLIRRVYIDLTGMPPEPSDLDRFINDDQTGAYERMVDRALSSPRFGERWARYWLDLAGYADSEGKREQDLPRAHAWRYRDYVINALNHDKPYDRFLVEQLAGDELYDYEHASEITEPMYEALVATGFLRMPPDPTWANITGYVPDRLEVMADAFDVLGSAVLGLTLKCARCHSHKFDPISQRDYYRMVDVFKGAYDEYNWIKPEVRPGIGPVSKDVIGGRTLPYVTTVERRAWEQESQRWEAEMETARSRGDSAESIQAIERRRPPEPRIQALWDQGEPSPTYMYRRGDPLNPGPLVKAGLPTVISRPEVPFVPVPPWPGSQKTGRRLAFAKWIVEPTHPLTARVAVNRLWKHHFGVGLVKTLGNFGRTGTPPSHPELLDWLADELIRNGWSLKAIHRMILCSATYQQGSTLDPKRLEADPDNRLISRMPLTRLDAESLYDSMLLISGELSSQKFGPADAISVRADGLASPKPSASGRRRLIYVQQQRKIVATHLESFDFPQMNPNCLERRDSIVAPQALYLFNNAMVFEVAEALATRIEREAGESVERQVTAVFQHALGRPPTAEQMKIGLATVGEFAAHWRTQLAGDATPSTVPGNADSNETDRTAQHRSLVDFCHAIFNSASFLYVD